jgi:hypothetical protein
MIHPQGFKDAKNFQIKNGFAYHFMVGDTYLSRFKNTLTLENKFENDDAFNDMMINVVNAERYKLIADLKAKFEPKPLKTYEDPICDRFDGYKISTRKSRNSRKMRNLKKRENSNTKKNKIRQNGYDEKVNNLRLSVPPLLSLSDTDPVNNINDEGNDYWIYSSKYFEDTSDMYNDDRSTTTSEEEDYRFECSVEYARYMLGR